MSFSNKYLQWIWFIALILFPFLLWAAPTGAMDDTGIIFCPSRFLFDIECLGCGMTRAVVHFHHLNFEEAIYYNLGVVVIYPALIIIWGYWVYSAAKRLELVGNKEEKEGLHASLRRVPSYFPQRNARINQCERAGAQAL